MLETKIKLLEDRPDRIVIGESLRPWQWGGFGFSLVQVALLLLFPFILVIRGTRKAVFDGVYQSVTIENRILFSHRKKQVQFSDIENIVLSLRKMTRVFGSTSPGRQGMGNLSMPVTLNLGELFLTLIDKSRLKIATTYWSDNEIKRMGNRVSELIGKIFVENRGNSNR